MRHSRTTARAAKAMQRRVQVVFEGVQSLKQAQAGSYQSSGLLPGGHVSPGSRAIRLVAGGFPWSAPAAGSSKTRGGDPATALGSMSKLQNKGFNRASAN